MAEYSENTFDVTGVPAPEKAGATEEAATEFNQDDILELINSVDEDGMCPCHIIASLERLIDVTEDMTLADVPEENREVIESLEIEDCTVDTYTLDGEIINAVLTFPSERNAYLHDLKELLDRYRLMQDEIASDQDAAGRVALFSVAFMPKALDGHGLMQVAFPIAYFRTLDDAGLNVCMHMMFHMDNIQFMQIDLDDDTLSEIQADVLREMESGTGGALFEE